MRASRTEMEKNHQKIVEGAARLLREQGLDGASVGEVMAAAGMTHGGFYRHFSGKEDLLREGLREAFAQQARCLETAAHILPPAEAAEQHRARYLSPAHLERPGRGCPMPAVGSEVARAPAALREEFGAGVTRMVAALANAMPGDDEERPAHAIRELAMLAGAVLIARACDAKTASRILAACAAAPKAP